MQNTLLSLVWPIAQAQGDTPNIVKPWQENWAIDAILIGMALFMILLIWLWARSGRSKRENNVPFERTAEDFAGTVQAGYGRIPPFLIVVYAAAFIAIAAYVVVAIINGTQY